MSDIHHPQKVARSGLIYTGTLVLQKILSFTYFSLVAAALGPQQLGLYVFVLSFSAFFSLAVDFGFVNLTIRNFARSSGEEESNFSLFFTARLLLALFALAAMAAAVWLLGYGRELIFLIAIAALIMVMDSFSAFFYALWRARQNLFYESIGTIVFQIIVLGAGAIALFYTRDLPLLLLVIATGSLWQIVYSTVLIKRKLYLSFRLNFNPGQMGLALRTAMPFFLAMGFIKAYNTLDTIFLKNLSGDLAAGLYAIPAKVTFTFPFIAMGITAAVYPAMSSYYSRGESERLRGVFRRTMQFLLTISLPIAVGIALLARPIIARIWPEFSESIAGLQILIWAVVFLYLEYPFGSLLLATGRERRNTLNRGVQLATFIVLNLILIPRWGFMGAVWTALLTSAEIVFLGWLATRRLVSIFNKGSVAVFLKVALASALMGALVWQLRAHYSFLFVIPIAAVVYLSAILLLSVYGRDDWQWLKGLIKKNS